MDLFGIVGVVGQGVGFALRQALRGPVREPFLLVLGIKLLVLIGLGHFYLPGLAGMLSVWVRWTGGEAAVHYPDLFWSLPEIMRSSEALLGVTLVPVCWGVATLRFAGIDAAWGPAARRAPALMCIGLAGPGVAWTITTLFNLVPLEIRLSSFVVRMGLQGIELGAIALVVSAIAYSIAAVMLGGDPLLGAFARSFRLFRQHFWVTLLLVGLPLAALFPPTFFLHEMNIATAGLKPEAIGLLLAILLVVKTLLSLLLIGALTFVYLSHQEAGR